LDFKEVWLEDGTAVSLFDIVDKATGIIIGSFAIDVTRERGKRRRKVNWREVQEALRLAFREWGLPERIQTDKELVFEGHPADLYPSSFQQWLVGLDIEFERTRPGRPQDQGRVERGHRTLWNFVCSQEERQDIAHFQSALTANRHLYNSKFPSRAKGCDGQPPLKAHPEALLPSRPYRPEEEWHLFSLVRVAHLLAQKELTRKVNTAGQISLGNRLYYLGKGHAGKHVRLRFDPATYTWVVFTQDGQEIKRFQPANFSKSYFLNQHPLVNTSTTFAREENDVDQLRVNPTLLLLFLYLYLQILKTLAGEGNVVLKNLSEDGLPDPLYDSQLCRDNALRSYLLPWIQNKSEFVKVRSP